MIWPYSIIAQNTAIGIFIFNTIVIFTAKIFYCFFIPLGRHKFYHSDTPTEISLDPPNDIILKVGKNFKWWNVILISNIFYQYAFYPFLPLIILYSIFS